MRRLSIHSPPLNACLDAPTHWWVRGDDHVFPQPCLAVVGSRRAGPEALRFAYRISRALAARGYVIVSGLARGVDTAAHAGALAANGKTIAVLAHGLDRIYPPENHALAERIAQNGACLSEYPPGEAPLPWRFPQRNRWIAALSLGVVVIEAGERSGSLGTARAALELGREVFVAPGPATADTYRGAHRLLQDGAKLIVDAEDIVQELPPSWRLPAVEVSPFVSPTSPPLMSLSDLARRNGTDLATAAGVLHGALAAGQALPYGVGHFLWLDDTSSTGEPTSYGLCAPTLAKPERTPKNEREDSSNASS